MLDRQKTRQTDLENSLNLLREDIINFKSKVGQPKQPNQDEEMIDSTIVNG